MDWTEKYRPKSLRDIVGNTQSINKMFAWAKEWEKGIQKHSALILEGGPGIGKTSAALALANDFGWAKIELNASDTRNESVIKDIALRGATYESFSDDGEYLSSKKGKRKLIILDEADSLYESSGKDGDKGGKKAIYETIKKSKQPIILIVNDLYALTKGSDKEIKKLCEIVKFRALTTKQIQYRILKRICQIENIRYNDEVLLYIARRSKGDVRASINDLQTVALGKKSLTIKDMDVLGLRDHRENIYGAVLKILHTTDYSRALESIKNLDEDPKFTLLWLEENISKEYKNSRDKYAAYDLLSKADVYFGRVRKRQQFALWAYALDLMAAVSIAKKKEYDTHPGYYSYPSWIQKMGRTKEIRSVRGDIILKLAMMLHTSSREVNEEIMTYFKTIYKNDMELRTAMSINLQFNEKEIRFLLDGKHDEVSETMQNIEKLKKLYGVKHII